VIEVLQMGIKDEDLKSKRQRRKEYQENMATLHEKHQRKWLKKQGKGYLLNFQDS